MENIKYDFQNALCCPIDVEKIHRLSFTENYHIGCCFVTPVLKLRRTSSQLTLASVLA